jgi:hypothetical protein
VGFGRVTNKVLVLKAGFGKIMDKVLVSEKCVSEESWRMSMVSKEQVWKNHGESAGFRKAVLEESQIKS